MRQDKNNFVPTEEQVAAESARLKHKKIVKSAFIGTINVLLVVAAIAVLISSFLLPVMQVSGNSMEPELNNGDIILLIKTQNLHTGDLISFTWNNKTLLKRVIAGPSDWVTIDGTGKVYVNGSMLDEPYVTEPGLGESDIEYPYQVPDGSYFVMGDKRISSIDSRSTLVGCVKYDQIIGKVLLRVWPLGF